MESRRSKKPRSIGIEPKTSRPRSGPASAWPQPLDRTHSDPAVAFHCASQTQSPGQGQAQRKETVRVSDARISAVVDCDSQASNKEDPFSRPHQPPHSTRLAADSSAAHGVVGRSEHVGSLLRANANCSDMLPWKSGLLSGNSHADCLTASDARMQVSLRSILLCWGATESESQPSFRGPWTFEGAPQQGGQVRRCPLTASST